MRDDQFSSRGALLGRLQIVAAAVLWSTSGFFAKAPWFEGWPAEDRPVLLAFWRSAFAALILVPLIRRPHWDWKLIPMVGCFAVMVWTFMAAMVHGPAANAIWLQYLAPAWVAIASPLLLKEPLTRSDIRMIACCLAGVLWILLAENWWGGSWTGHTLEQPRRPVFATTMGLLSGVTFAGVVLCIRCMRNADPAWLITCNHSAAALILLFWVKDTSGSVPITSYVALALFGIFQMSVPYVLFTRGLRTTTGPEASVLTLIEPLLVPLWVYLAWRHHPTYTPPGWWTWVGAAMILTGLVSRYLPELIVQRRARAAVARAAQQPTDQRHHDDPIT